jgi:superfamily II DNA or RNA helicase
MECTIQIKDEVNIKFIGLDAGLRRSLEKKLKYFQPWAYHSPAYKLGRWDGCVSFFSLGGSSFFNLLEEILPSIIDHGYHITIDDLRPHHNFSFTPAHENMHSHIQWPKKHPKAGEPVSLRDYQIEAINKFLEAPQCVQEIATGAGKTVMTATLSKSVEQYGRSLVIVPNKDLVKQTYEDYDLLGLDVGVYFGDKKELDKRHTICTWQSLNSMEKKFKNGESQVSLDDFAQDVIAVIVDECHQAKADILKQLLTSSFAHVPIRWGLTGTIPKENYEQVTLLASIGPVINKIAARDLQDIGVLANCQVNILQLQDTAEYSSYQEELTFLTTNIQRIDHIANFVKRISSTGNTLVLVDRVKCGEMLVERIPESSFVSGAMKTSDRKDEYDEVATSQNKVIVATYGVAAVGINIPRIFNLVLLEPGKSFVRVIQSIGRGIRRAEDKDHVEIWDVTSSAKFSKRHLATRKKYYEEAGYPYNLQKVKYK